MIFKIKKKKHIVDIPKVNTKPYFLQLLSIRKVNIIKKLNLYQYWFAKNHNKDDIETENK